LRRGKKPEDLGKPSNSSLDKKRKCTEQGEEAKRKRVL